MGCLNDDDDKDWSASSNKFLLAVHEEGPIIFILYLFLQRLLFEEINMYLLLSKRNFIVVSQFQTLLKRIK